MIYTAQEGASHRIVSLGPTLRMSNINYLSPRYAAPHSQWVMWVVRQSDCLFVAPQCICLSGLGHLLATASGHWPAFWPGRGFIKSHTCSWPRKKNVYIFTQLRFNAHKCFTPPPTLIYIYTPYSYDIFLYSRKCAAPPASSFRFSSMAAHEKQIKVDLPLLTSLLARPSLYISFLVSSCCLFISGPRLLLCSYKRSLGSHWAHKEH